MKIKTTGRYKLNIGYDKLITPIGEPDIISGAELRTILADDMRRARRYFGAAVMHSNQIGDRIFIDVTARRDERSALWGRWIVKVIK
jgi:hypothetical protein